MTMSLEAHPQHLVRFVQDEEADLGKADNAALHTVQEAARRCDEKVAALPYLPGLVLEAGAAVQHHGAQRGPRREAPRLVLDLNGELAGGRDNDRLRGLGGAGPRARASFQQPVQ